VANVNKRQLGQQILTILGDEQRPVSAPELMDLLAKKGITPNKTSVYRQLPKLVAEDKVNEVLLAGNTSHFEISGHHHHHFMCSECNGTFCLHDNALEEEIHRLERELVKKGRHVERHEFSIIGLCEKCA
jgi:Fur family ferric uptake transcriptional regulator